MKRIDKMSRLTGELEKIFRMLNEDFFDGALPTPIITVIPSARSYAHYVPYDIWDTKGSGKREINIASGTLDRPLENIVASLCHEMVHMLCDCVLNVQDTSNKGIYHNMTFKREAEAHGLIISRSELKHIGWSHTEPSERLLEWVLEHDELREIEMCRAEMFQTTTGVGTHTGNTNGTRITGSNPNSHHRKYICPVCGCSCRATKQIHLMCMDCLEPMIEA